MLSAVNISWLDSPGNRSRPCNLFQSPRNKPVTKQIAVRYQWWSPLLTQGVCGLRFASDPLRIDQLGHGSFGRENEADVTRKNSNPARRAGRSLHVVGSPKHLGAL